MFRMPAAAESLVEAVREAFTRPTFRRFVVLMTGLIITMGRRTVSHALVPMRPKLRGHWSDYHRIYSQARFSMWRLAAVMVRQVVALLPSDWPIEVVADDTVEEKNGYRVWACSGHRDARRSSRGKTHIQFGHMWLVMCVLVRLPWVKRPWALPILCGLCLSAKVAGKLGRRPKTAAQLARQLLIKLMRWLPDRKFILIGDHKVVTHQTVCFAQRHADRVTAIGRLRGDANLYEPPKNPRRRSRGGGHARKGKKAASPSQRLGELRPQQDEVAWYGSSRRVVQYVSQTALWYDRHASEVTPIRWVGVRGDGKALDDAYFFCSDPALPAARIIELYAGRWNIEVTFEEARALLGLSSTRHWCRQSVLRVMPILLGLFTAVTLIWSRLPRRKQTQCSSRTPCYAKQNLTFADALFAVRQELWAQLLQVRRRPVTECLTAVPRSVRQMLLWHLASAA